MRGGKPYVALLSPASPFHRKGFPILLLYFKKLVH
jgi:hypothetical protein